MPRCTETSTKEDSNTMRSRTRIFVAGATVALFGALSSVALAVSPHFKHGGEPTCTITSTGASSSSTTCSATLAGLGNFDVQADLSVSGTAVYQCQNQGGNIAPGQNKVMVGPQTTPVVFPASAIKNGSLTVSVSST